MSEQAPAQIQEGLSPEDNDRMNSLYREHEWGVEDEMASKENEEQYSGLADAAATLDQYFSDDVRGESRVRNDLHDVVVKAVRENDLDRDPSQIVDDFLVGLKLFGNEFKKHRDNSEKFHEKHKTANEAALWRAHQHKEEHLPEYIAQAKQEAEAAGHEINLGPKE